MHEGKGLKLSINLEMPKEPEYKMSIEDKVLDCMEKLEYGTDRAAYQYLRKLNNYLVEKYKCGKCTDRMTDLLRKLTPFMAKHGLQDPQGIVLVEEMVTNPDYEKDKDELQD